jgi:segregation and condensation protein B
MPAPPDASIMGGADDPPLPPGDNAGPGGAAPPPAAGAPNGAGGGGDRAPTDAEGRDADAPGEGAATKAANAASDTPAQDGEEAGTMLATAASDAGEAAAIAETASHTAVGTRTHGYGGEAVTAAPDMSGDGVALEAPGAADGSGRGPPHNGGTEPVAADASADGAIPGPDGAQAPDGDPASAEPRGGASFSAAEAEAPDADPALFAHALRIAEALVFASDRPVTPARLQGALPPGCDARAVLTALAAACADRPAQLVEVAGGFAFRTAPELAPAITRVVEVPRRLPRAAMETLAIVAYHQPVTRAEIEEIRGASLSQSTLELLLDAALIAPRGRKEVPGRPSLWGTTPRFLEHFGLKALADLPRREELVNEPPTLPLQAPPTPQP